MLGARPPSGGNDHPLGLEALDWPAAEHDRILGNLSEDGRLAVGPVARLLETVTVIAPGASIRASPLTTVTPV